jgi:hypothetical protein
MTEVRQGAVPAAGLAGVTAAGSCSRAEIAHAVPPLARDT